MLTNDFVTMARAADRAPPSVYLNAWCIRDLTLAAIPLGLFRLLYLVAVLCLGWWALHLSPSEMQTLTFAMLVFAGQGNVYVLRTHGRFWRSRPAPILLVVTTLLFTLAMDSIKLAVFARVRID
jgi:H+-transporting ATPase